MKKLTIVIPQYKESEVVLRRTLDSVEHQQGIKIEELEVIIVNDCTNIYPSEQFLKQYSFDVRLVLASVNRGAGVSRQLGVDRASGKYILFLDADDMLYCCTSLRHIMNYKGNADIIVGKFMNEQGNKIDNAWTWVHGKFFKKQYLKDKNIRFANNIRVNEDGCYCDLARVEAKKIEFIDDVVTFWSANPNSITREKREQFVVNSFSDFIKGREWLFERYTQENKTEEIRNQIGYLFCYEYYYLMQKEFREHAKERKALERQLMELVKKYWNIFKTLNEADFDKLLALACKTFIGYVDYRPRETFDNFRKRLYKIEI